VKAPADFVSNRNKILNESITVVYSPLIKTEKERVSIQDAIENVLMTSENISKANKKSIKNCSRHQEQYKVMEQIKKVKSFWFLEVVIYHKKITPKK